MCSGMNNGESGAGPLSSGRTSHRGAQRGTGSGHCRWRHCTKVQWTGEGSCAKSLWMSRSFLTFLDDDGESRSPVRTSSKHPLLVNWRKD
jgi:hypothetical protein